MALADKQAMAMMPPFIDVIALQFNRQEQVGAVVTAIIVD